MQSPESLSYLQATKLDHRDIVATLGFRPAASSMDMGMGTSGACKVSVCRLAGVYSRHRIRPFIGRCRCCGIGTRLMRVSGSLLDARTKLAKS